MDDAIRRCRSAAQKKSYAQHFRQHQISIFGFCSAQAKHSHLIHHHRMAYNDIHKTTGLDSHLT